MLFILITYDTKRHENVNLGTLDRMKMDVGAINPLAYDNILCQ